MTAWRDHDVRDSDELVVIKHVRIPMADGIRLAADLYAPAGFVGSEAEPLPAVLDYIPYRKDEVEVGGWGAWYYGDLARAGYVVARVDIRGTGSSEGVAVDEYSPDELADGSAVVEWLAAQPWCDGHVCMTGISYGGFTSLLVAGQAPPSLTAIAPMFFGEDRYANGDHYRGGLLGLWFDLGYYGTYLAAFNLLPPDPQLDDWRERWSERLEHNEPYLLRWLRHQSDGPFWRGGSVIDVVDRIRCPTLMIGGWRDAYPNGPLRLFPRLAVPKSLLVGPWNHAVPDIAIPGPRIDYVREIVAWFDRWCGRRGEDEDSAPVRVFMQRWQPPDPRRLDAVGDWRAETTWPPAASRFLTLYPDASGVLAEAPSNGVDRLRYAADVGPDGGLFCYMSFGQSGDQRRDDAQSLVYDSAPLTDELAVLGPSVLRLRVTSPVEVLGFVGALSEVAPDGRSLAIARGALNATRRNGLECLEPIPLGEPIDLELSIDATGWVFATGHRIRLRLACADWPNLWPTPYTATVEVDRAGSSLELPIVPAEGPLPVPRLEPAPQRDLSSATVPARWRLSRDLATGQSHFELRFGRSYLADGGTRRVERSFRLDARVDPAHPGQASARGHHRSVIIGDGFEISARATTTVRASSSALDVRIEVELRSSDRPAWRRIWRERIPRDLL